jgi:hypothetical protein
MAKHKQERKDDLWGYPQLMEAEILRCCGCDLLSFRLLRRPFEFQDKRDKAEEDIYPERDLKKRNNRYFFYLPRGVQNLYQETLAAYDRDLVLLSTVGLRALIEAIVADNIDEKEYGQNLESKINALAKYFKEPTINTLHDFRIMGNKAIHAQITPNHLDVHRALNIVESIMEFFYGIDEHVNTYQLLKETKKKKVALTKRSSRRL